MINNVKNNTMWQNVKFFLMLIIFVGCLFGSDNNQQMRSSFVKESINALNYPATLPKPKGKIVDGIIWNDSSGKNVIIVSSYQKGAPLENGYASEIQAYQYHLKGTAYDTVWKIKDFNYTDAQVEYATGTLKLLDIDNDGVAESSFFYTIASNDRQVTKSILHTKGRKLAIRGYYTIFDSGEEPKQDSLVVDPAFKKVDKMFQAFAENEWREVTE